MAAAVGEPRWLIVYEGVGDGGTWMMGRHTPDERRRREKVNTSSRLLLLAILVLLDNSVNDGGTRVKDVACDMHPAGTHKPLDAAVASCLVLG